MCGYGAQQLNAADPSSYWGRRDLQYIGEGTILKFDTGITVHPLAEQVTSYVLLQYKQHQPCGFDEDGHGTMCAGSNEGAVNSNIANPARYDETICVGSNDRNGGKSSSSPEGAAMVNF